MNLINRIKNVISGIGLAAILTTGFVGLSATPAMAHETKCPYCKLDVVQDTKDQDNEVLLRAGNKRIEYRCIMCAIAQAKTKFKGDLTILAPSNVKGKKITVERKDGKWTTTPDTAVFVFQKGNHSKCQDLYRAIADKKTAEDYAQNKGLSEAKFLNIAEMVEQSK